MGIEDERSHTKREHREPEVDEIRRPDGQSGVEQHQQVPHAHVDAWPCEPGVENGEGQPGDTETTTSGNVTSTTERQVTQDGL